MLSQYTEKNAWRCFAFGHDDLRLDFSLIFAPKCNCYTTTKTIALLQTNNMFCIRSLNCFWFSFLLQKIEQGLSHLFWSCSIMFMCLPTIKLQKRRTWVERSWMHHKFCLLMISAKTSLTSSLRSIASMLFVVASSLAALNRLSFESASFLLLAWIISNEKSAVQPGK